MRYFLLLCGILFFLRFHFPPQLFPKKGLVNGTIISIPQCQSHTKKFIFLLHSPHHPPQRLWCQWYAAPPVHLQIGDQWQLDLKIQPLHSTWLLAENLNGKATVIMNWHNQLLLRQAGKFPINHLRESISHDLQQIVGNTSGLGFISALSLGLRDHISQVQWQDLRNTGTNHLMAIAGLHLGFVTSIAYVLFNRLWRYSVRLLLWCPAQTAATYFALCVAFIYSALAGFSLPTQRALIMLSVFLGGQLIRRTIGLWQRWTIALGCIISWQPLSVLSPSFWLSFGAVALLIIGLAGRLGPQNIWWHWTRAQWVMAIGLIPLSAIFFHQISWTSLFANLIAIPFIGWVILPLCVGATLLDPISIRLASYSWQLANSLLMHFWPFIHFLAHLPYSQWQSVSVTFWPVLSALIGVLLLLAPKGWPARWLGLIWLLPILLAGTIQK